jgi:hypothetical protein
MKDLIIASLLLLGFSCSMNAQAQNYKAFEWDIVRLGFVIPSGDGVKGGIAISTEPRLNITDNISAGIRFEFALFNAEEIANQDIELSAASSTALMADYYFSNSSSNRAFAGIGIIPRIGYEVGYL